MDFGIYLLGAFMAFWLLLGLLGIGVMLRNFFHNRRK
jgi:hypothetical protein